MEFSLVPEDQRTCWCGREALINCDHCGAPRCVIHAEPVDRLNFTEKAVQCWPGCKPVVIDPLTVAAIREGQEGSGDVAY